MKDRKPTAATSQMLLAAGVLVASWLLSCAEVLDFVPGFEFVPGWGPTAVIVLVGVPLLTGAVIGSRLAVVVSPAAMVGLATLCTYGLYPHGAEPLLSEGGWFLMLIVYGVPAVLLGFLGGWMRRRVVGRSSGQGTARC